MSTPRTLVNGEPGDLVPASDRGFQFGDGLFETLRMVRGRAPLWDRHMARLTEGARRLALPAPDTTALADECRQVCAGHPAAVCKIIYTRGSGGAGYTPPEPARPLRVVMRRDLPPAAHGLALTFCRTPLAIHPRLAGLKRLASLEQVLARRELAATEYTEGLMVDTEGTVVEATTGNLFLLRDNVFYTPALDRCGVAGVMRALLLDMLAEQGRPARQPRISVEDCRHADGLFVCNAVRGILPVSQLDKRSWPRITAIEELATQVNQVLSGDRKSANCRQV